MRIMSFAATTAQMYAGTKTVTRRIDRKGWWAKVLVPGTLVCAVEKSQGLKKGEKVKRIGVIEIVSVRREPLEAIALRECGELYSLVPPGRCDYEPGLCLEQGCRDLEARPNAPNAATADEGFPHMTPAEFMRLFCSLNGCKTDATITRIEFKHRPDLSVCCGEERLQLHDAELDVDFTACSACKRVQP